LILIILLKSESWHLVVGKYAKNLPKIDRMVASVWWLKC